MLPKPNTPDQRTVRPSRARSIGVAVLLAALALIFLIPRVPAPPPSPDQPETVFVDKAGLVSEGFAQETASWLHAINLFEAVVYIDGNPPEGDLQPWTVQTAAEWGIGRERHDRGLVLFIFPDAQIARIEIGYGLEGALPDLRVKQMFETSLVPAFSAGQYENGLEDLIKTLYQSLGGDAESARLALEEAGKPHDAWAETLEGAWSNGARMLPAVWRFYSQGSYLDRFGVLAFATPLLFFATVSLVAFGVSLRMLILLPGKLSELWATPTNSEAASTLVPKNLSDNASKVPGDELLDAGPGWGTFMLVTPIALGIFLFLINAGIAIIVFSMAPDYFTRQGQYGGGGVAVSWSVPDTR